MTSVPWFLVFASKVINTTLSEGDLELNHSAIKILTFNGIFKKGVKLGEENIYSFV